LETYYGGHADVWWIVDKVDIDFELKS